MSPRSMSKSYLEPPRVSVTSMSIKSSSKGCIHEAEITLTFPIAEARVCAASLPPDLSFLKLSDSLRDSTNRLAILIASGKRSPRLKVTLESLGAIASFNSLTRLI